MKLKAALVLVATMVVVTAGGMTVSSPAVAAVPIVEAADQAGLMPEPPKISAAEMKAAYSPPGIKAPKGSPLSGGVSKTTSRTAASSVASFAYNTMQQDLVAPQYATGMAVNSIISKPFLAPTDYHSLTELSVMATPGSTTKNAVEVGWTVDDTLNGGSYDPHLFVFWWKNGVGQGYNGSGFVPYTATCSVAGAKCAGSSLASNIGQQKRMEIRNTGTAWWVAWDAQWIGYFPNTLWTNSTPSGPGVTFNSATRFQAFGEVAYPNTQTTSCSDMGNGQYGTTASPIPARVGSALLSGQNPSTIVTNMSNMYVQPSSWNVAYALSPVTATTMNYGGPGYTSTGTTPGNIGSC